MWYLLSASVPLDAGDSNIMIMKLWTLHFYIGFSNKNGSGEIRLRPSLSRSMMGVGHETDGDCKNKEEICQNNAICLHAFSDLSRTSPATFVYLLKECYTSGTRKAMPKFRVLQQQVLQALYNEPQPGPAVFIIQCLYILPSLGPPYTEGFSHLLISSFCRLKTLENIPDCSQAKLLATQLFLNILARAVPHEERILVKILQIFKIDLKDLGKVICGSKINLNYLDEAKAHIRRCIYGFIESQSYMTAVTLLEHFSICLSPEFGEEFLNKIIHHNQFQAAEKWAVLMGKDMICLLVQKYVDMNMLKNAYCLIKGNNLMQEFPDARHLYKRSSIKKLAEKGCWDVAEVKAENDNQLVVYLVYLALEAGYTEKVDELCERYSLDGFIKESGETPVSSRYLHLDEFVLEDIIWIDEVEGLRTSTSYIEECSVVGVDCEWKPNYVKGSKPNKVSIIQIASEKRVYIFDLIKLYDDHPETLDNCFKRILHSSKVLKLGYNLHCDMHQLSQSYADLECFRYYEMLLDVQKIFKEPKGGLSGLAKKLFGAGLNKTRRNSNWEQRPLSQNQIEYAALDAAVLLKIFSHVRGQPIPDGGSNSKMEWKSHIVSHMKTNRPRRIS